MSDLPKQVQADGDGHAEGDPIDPRGPIADPQRACPLCGKPLDGFVGVDGRPICGSCATDVWWANCIAHNVWLVGLLIALNPGLPARIFPRSEETYTSS